MNDWIVAKINNPEFTVSDFYDIADMTVENTQLKSRDFYLNSDYIKNNDLFKNENGEFSKDKFNAFYDEGVKGFLEFQQNEFPRGLELDMFDTNRTKDSKVRDNNFNIGRLISNPNRQKIGVEGVNVWSDPEKSISELAQDNFIYDFEKGEFKDYTPNDNALIDGERDWGWTKSIFEDPLVLAQYEEDGEHQDPITGQIVKHKKGDYKLNDKGTYYYETLGGRSSVGKQVLSLMDTVTIDGTGINKYDFFDSDDVEKSVGGVIAKNVVTLLPMFIGGPVGTAYATALIAREMAKSLPMIYGVSTALFNTNETPTWMNSVAAFGEKFTGGTSQYAKENTFSFENFGSLIADVALQWGLQKQIAKAFNYLLNNKNYIDEAVEKAHQLYLAKEKSMPAQAAMAGTDWKTSVLGQACLKKYLPEAEKAAIKAGELGRNSSLIYMSIISNSDVYGDMLDRGLTKKEAAAIALGSTLGMFAVDKTGLGELFFDDATGDSVKAIRSMLKKEFAEASETIFKQAKQEQKNGLLALINNASKLSRKLLNKFSEDVKYHTTNMYEKMIGEGIEEVSEELVTDTAKSIYELAGSFGFDTTLKDVGSWDNALDRYAMSFFGGAIGGGVFYGKEVFDGKSFKRDKSNEELAVLLRNGHADDIRNEITKFKNKGKVANTKLSGKSYELVDGQPVWLTTSNKEDSQNDVIANMVLDKVNAIDAVINNNQVGLSDDQLFQQMVLGELRYTRYQDIAHITNYYQDFNNVVNDLIAAELDLKAASKTIDGTVEGKIATDPELRSLSPEAEQLRQRNIQVLQDKYNKAVEAKNLFLSGDTSLDYSRKLNFAIDPILHSPFLKIDEAQMRKDKFKDRTDISEEEELEFQLELYQAKLTYLKNNLTESWKRFKDIEKVIAPDLMNIAQQVPEFKKWHTQFTTTVLPKLEKISEDFKNSHLSWDDILPGEDLNLFEHRNTPLTINEDGVERLETPEEYVLRRNKRVLLINKQYEDFAENLRNELVQVNYQVDPLIYKELLGPRGIIFTRIKDLFDIYGKSINDKSLKVVFKKLNLDLSNSQDVIDDYKKLLKELLTLQLSQSIDKIGEMQIHQFNGTNEYNIRAWTFIMEALREAEEAGGFLTYGDLLNYKSQDFVDMNDEQLMSDLENISKVIEEEIIPYVGDDCKVDEESTWKALDSYVEKQANIGINALQSVLLEISNNPIYKLNTELQNSVKNPIVEFIKSFSGKVIDSKKLPDIEFFLNEALKVYNENTDITDWILNETLLKALHETKDIIDLISTYIYAASSTSDPNNIVGHNKVMNEFAKNHSDVVRNWEELPEIDSDYAALYQTLLNRYNQIFKTWIEVSNQNQINKKALFQKTDKAFIESLWGFVSDKIEKGAFTVEIDDLKYNLLEGYSTSENVDSQIALFNFEKAAYVNLQNLLKKTGLSITEFAKKSKFLDEYISDEFKNLTPSNINSELTKDTLTNYDKYQYLSIILTQNPVDFYTKLKDRVKASGNIAPITILEYGSRMAQAATSQQFRDLIKYGHEKSGSLLPGMYNTVIITGAAGAGKTQVVVKGATDGIEPEKVWALGPTTKLSESLQKSIKCSVNKTIEGALKELLGEELFVEVKASLDEIKRDLGKFSSTETKFFKLFVENGMVCVTLKPDSITFKDIKDFPKTIVIDEATHVNSLYALIFNLYMSKVGGTLCLVGDPNQRGYKNPKNYIGNIASGTLFCVRAPELTISLRDNNIQKQENLNKVLSVLKTLENYYTNATPEEYKSYAKNTIPLISNFKFKVYNQEEINGDLIIPSITPEIISKIKNSKKSIGFIGDLTSPVYTKLIESGLKENVDFKVLSMDLMQGQEFDIVLIDHKFKTFNNPHEFLKDLYTLMSRGREASIFIDNDLSSHIGSNEISEYQAKAPSLTTPVNGKSPIDELRESKLEILNQLDLTPITLEDSSKKEVKKSSDEKAEEEPKEEPSEEPKEEPEKEKTEEPSVEESPKNPEEDFIDPDKREEKEPALEQNDVDDEEEGNIDFVVEPNIDPTEESLYEVPTYSEVTYMGVNSKEVERDGFKAPLWTIPEASDGPLRNMLALLLNQEKYLPSKPEAFTMLEKLKWMGRINGVKSACIYNHEDFSRDIDAPMPECIQDNFTPEAWKDRKILIEFRPADNEVLPIFAAMPEAGMKYKGKTFIANIVLSVINKDGKECRIDIGGLNNPETLRSKLTEIKKNINEKIDSAEKRKYSDKTIAKLKNIASTIDDQVTEYEKLFDNWFLKYDAEKNFELDVTEAISYNKCTWLKKRKTPIRLGGRIDPGAVQLNRPKEDAIHNKYRNLKTLNPNLRFSPIYTYSSKSNEIEGLDPSVKGKAVVFVTSDTLLSSSSLPSIYAQQKSNPEQNSPTVRMVVLGNYGMTFSQMADSNFVELIQGGSEKRKPMRLNFNGLRMFTTLWNWRAALKLFNNAVTKFKEENEYSDKKLDLILEAEYEIFKNSSKSIEERLSDDEICKKYGITKSDLEALSKFNLETLKNIPTFRLGHSSNGNGFHVLQYSVEGSSEYKNKSTAALLSISPDTANKFFRISDDILSTIIPNNEIMYPLGVTLKKPDGANWNPDEFIDFKNAKHRRSLSGVLHSDSSHQMIITIGDESLALVEGNEWSMIPKYLSNIVGKTVMMQKNPNDPEWERHEVASIHHQNDHNLTELPVSDWIEEGILQAEKSDTVKDRTLLNMFDLMFHGTIEDIHDTSSKRPLKLDDAYFKKGFFIDPDAKRVINDSGNFVTVNIDGLKGNPVFMELDTREELFVSDVDVKPASINLNVGKLKNLLSTKKSIPDTPKPEELIRTVFAVKVTNEVTDTLENFCGKMGFNSDDQKELIRFYNSKHLGGAILEPDTLNLILENDGVLLFVNLLQYIESLGYTFIEVKDRVIRVKLNEDSGKLIIRDSGEIEFIKDKFDKTSETSEEKSEKDLNNPLQNAFNSVKKTINSFNLEDGKYDAERNELLVKIRMYINDNKSTLEEKSIALNELDLDNIMYEFEDELIVKLYNLIIEFIDICN